MHSGAAHDLGIDVMRSRRWRSALRLRSWLRRVAAQACDDVVGVLGSGQEFGLGRVIEHVRQRREHP